MKNHRMRTTAQTLILALTATLLSACAGMGPGYETPTVSVQSFRPVDSGGGNGLPAFEIGLRVINPNLEPLELAGVSYTISLNGQEVIKGVGNDLPVIAGYGEGSFTLTASFNLMAGIRLFRSLMDEDSDSLDYSIDGKLDPGSFKRKIRISDSGTVSLSN
ncbi:MAG: LEA type 2 family protein [Woeseiaceae bacterium]